MRRNLQTAASKEIGLVRNALMRFDLVCGTDAQGVQLAVQLANLSADSKAAPSGDFLALNIPVRVSQ